MVHVFPGDVFERLVQLPSRAGSEKFIEVDDWDGLSPVAKRAELWHDKGFVLLFTQQREHVLHQFAEPAVPAERQERAGVVGQQ